MPIANNPWIKKREQRRLTGLVLPIAMMLIAIRLLLHYYTVTQLLAAIGFIVVCGSGFSWVWYWRHRHARSVSALMPVGTLRSLTGWPEGTRAELVEMGRLSFQGSELVWVSRRNPSVQVVWPVDQIGRCAVKRVWGLIPNYYLFIAQTNGTEVILWTHYAPEIVEDIRELQAG